jgi:hypothetical protein
VKSKKWVICKVSIIWQGKKDIAIADSHDTFISRLCYLLMKRATAPTQSVNRVIDELPNLFDISSHEKSQKSSSRVKENKEVWIGNLTNAVQLP